jgi:hypothetical protein
MTRIGNPIEEAIAADPGRARAGFVVWGVAIVFIAGSELAAAFSVAPWPTISATTGHLEDKWAWVALIVVFIVVYAAYCVFPGRDHSNYLTVAPVDNQPLTPGGRRVQASVAKRNFDPDRGHVRVARLGDWYLLAAIVVTGAAIVTAIFSNRTSGEGPFVGAYILYGVIAVAWVILPNVLAYVRAKEVAFPTFVWTLHIVYHRWRFLAVILLAALTILLIHLALYPWPSIIHDLQHHAPSKQSP